MTDQNDAAAPEQSPGIVLVGEEDRPVSIRVIHDVFTTITGRSQSLRKYYYEHYRIELQEIETLHHCLEQVLKQYHLIAGNCTVRIYLTSNESYRLNSFEEFAKYSVASAAATEQVYYKLSFVVVPPQQQRTQSYEIEVFLPSGVGWAKSLSRPPFRGVPQEFIRRVARSSPYVDLSFADFTIAKALQRATDDWFASLPQASLTQPIEFLQARSHYFPRAARALTATVVGVGIALKFPTILASDPVTLQKLGQVLVATFLLFSGSRVVAGWFGEWLEITVDKWTPVSYLNLSKADAREIERAFSKNKRSMFSALVAFLGAFGMAVGTELLAKVLLGWLTGERG